MAMALAREMARELDNRIESIFIGDSMARWFPFGQLIHKLDTSIRTVAYTITGYKMKNQIRFAIQKPTPELAIIFTGGNDIAFHKKEDNTPPTDKEIIEAFCDTVKELHQNGITIIVIPIQPRGDTHQHMTGISVEEFNYRRTKINQQLTEKLEEIIGYNPMTIDSAPRQLNYNKIHFSPNDYENLTKEILAKVEELFPQREVTVETNDLIELGDQATNDTISHNVSTQTQSICPSFMWTTTNDEATQTTEDDWDDTIDIMIQALQELKIERMRSSH